LVLIKLWVEVLTLKTRETIPLQALCWCVFRLFSCANSGNTEDFGDDQRVDSAPLLYHSITGYPSPLPKKLIGLILEKVSKSLLWRLTMVHLSFLSLFDAKCFTGFYRNY
jgi:hypothetical protein